MSTNQINKRRATISDWDISDISNAKMRKKSPAKIGTRRKSLRLMNKEHNNEIENSSSSEVQKDDATNIAAASDNTFSDQIDFEVIDSIELNIKCELSLRILNCFDNIIRDKLDLKRYSANCKICDEYEPRKFFRKGNYSNLKSHLKRVSILLG